MELMALRFLARLLQRGIPEIFAAPAPRRASPLPVLYGKLITNL